MSGEETGKRETAPETQVYGEDAGLRIGSGVIAGIMLALVIACVSGLFLDLSSITKSPLQVQYMAIIGAVVFGVMAVLSAYYAGPNRLTLDFAQRTYMAVRGFPLFPKTFSGPLSEIKELYLRERNGKGPTTWQIMAGWKQADRADFRLVACTERPAAQAQMQALADRIGVPADPKPRPWSGM